MTEPRPMTPLLDGIHLPADLKGLSTAELRQVVSSTEAVHVGRLDVRRRLDSDGTDHTAAWLVTRARKGEKPNECKHARGRTGQKPRSDRWAGHVSAP